MAKNSNVQQVLSNKGDAIDERSEAGLGDAEPGDGAPTYATREDRIRLAAYLAAERRGFTAGSEAQDWLDAEQQVDGERDEGAAPGSAP